MSLDFGHDKGTSDSSHRGFYLVHPMLSSHLLLDTMPQPEHTIRSVEPLHIGQFLIVRIETNHGIIGYGEAGVWGHRIPDALSDVAAAPLQCGRGTVFQALLGIKPTETVSSLGVGGLGHLAIQFAAKMGCRVVVLSGSDRKREEAFKLGAHEFVATRDAKELSVSAQIDRLLVTAAVPPDWSLLVPILAPRAAIYPLTVNMGNFSIPYMALISRGIHIVGSQVPGRAIHKQMLEFAALHHVEPITETFPMTEGKITEAMDKLDRGEMYYQAVLIPQ
ncbi:hypothetical protein BJX65DRAFT_289253 [Aspergillus insuetus]